MEPEGSNASFVTDKSGPHLTGRLEHLVCFFPGSVALGVLSGAVRSPARAARYTAAAERMGEACMLLHAAAGPAGGGLAAEAVHINASTGVVTVVEPQYRQRPEVAESLFYLWRLTRQQRWRDHAWAIFSALRRHCSTPMGFTGVANITDPALPPDDAQQSWLLAEMLKVGGRSRGSRALGWAAPWLLAEMFKASGLGPHLSRVPLAHLHARRASDCMRLLTQPLPCPPNLFAVPLAHLHARLGAVSGGVCAEHRGPPAARAAPGKAAGWRLAGACTTLRLPLCPAWLHACLTSAALPGCNKKNCSWFSVTQAREPCTLQ